MSDKSFVDTNLLIYAHDMEAGRRHEIGKDVLQKLWADRTGILSIQVLQEFYVNVTRKIPKPLTKPKARAVVETYAVWCVDANVSDLTVAFRIEDEASIGFRDALIIAAAARGGASRVLSEDLNAGQVIAGLLIENPFSA